MRKQIVNPKTKRYNSSEKVTEDRRRVRKTAADRVELLGLLEDARQGRGDVSLLDVADMYEQRGSIADLKKAKVLRREAGR